jgi:tRNA uridine 5-carboxymethylaminomethyl modification enzyme
MQEAINDHPNLSVVEGSVSDLIVENGKCKGIKLSDNSLIRSNAVILTTGTFLAGRCHIGQEGIDAGRFMRHDDDETTVIEKGGKFG